jgi:hypothetical protein
MKKKDWGKTTIMDKLHHSDESTDFSIVLGGPLFQFLRRIGLITPSLGLFKKRIIAITLFAWLPLLLLSLFEGKAWANTEMPFLLDMEASVRFLVALPLLIVAELLVHTRLRTIVGQFVEQDIITKNTLPKFKELIESAMNLRNSMPIELFLLFLTFVGGHYLTNTVGILEQISANTNSWYADNAELRGCEEINFTVIEEKNGSDFEDFSERRISHPPEEKSSEDESIFPSRTVKVISLRPLTPAGYWYIFVSRPLFQFLLFRLYFRVIVWIRFLWQTSKLNLNLISTHPDHACGLGFLAISVIAFIPFILAHGTLMAGIIGNAIFYAGAKLPEFIGLLISIVIFLQVLILGPLVPFARNMLRAKLAGIRYYGALASEYTHEFDRKWVHEVTTHTELLGSSDIQSLADIGNSFQVIRHIQTFPFNKQTSLQLALFTLLPVVPLLLTMVPLEELLKKLIGVVL